MSQASELPFLLQDPSCLTHEPLPLLLPKPGHPFHLPCLWAHTPVILQAPAEAQTLSQTQTTFLWIPPPHLLRGYPASGSLAGIPDSQAREEEAWRNNCWKLGAPCLWATHGAL